MTAVLKVLLLLLKWLGIVLLVVLGLILLIVLLVLLAPIRYKGKLAKKEVPEEILSADALVSWLNPFLRIRILFREKKLRYTVRIFGVCQMDSEKPKKEKKKDKPKKAKKKKSEKKQKESRKKKKAGQNPVAEQPAESMQAENPAALTEQLSEASSEVGTNPGPSDETITESEANLAPEADGDVKKKSSLFTKLKAFVGKIKAIQETIKQKVGRFVNTLKLLWYKKEKVVAFFEDELHILALGKSWKAVRQLLGHMLPGKIKGHVEFGTGDPESTGKALGVLGVLYAAYGKGLTIVPDFYEKRVVAELKLKGRIRCGTVLVICLKLIRDKQVKRFYSNWKKLLKLLKQKAE